MALNEPETPQEGQEEAVSANEYIGIGREIRQARTSSLKLSMLAASQTTPDRAAQVLELSKRAKLPPSIVERNFDHISKKLAVQDHDYEGILRDTPGLARWLANPDNSALARDDIPHLKNLTKDYLGALGSGAVGAAGSTFSGIGELYDIYARGVHSGLRAALPAGWYPAEEQIKRDTPWWATPQGLLRAEGEGLKGIAQQLGPSPDRQTLGTDIAQGVGQLGTQIAAALLSGGASGAVSTVTLTAQGADIMAEKTRDDEAPQVMKDIGTVSGAAVTALTERYGLGLLLDRVPPAIKNRVLQKLADIAIASGIEASQEVAEGLLHDVTRKVLTNEQAPIGEGISREAMAAGGAAGIVRTAFMAATGTKLRNQVKQREEFITDLGKSVEKSKLLERAPEKFQEFVAEQVKGTPLEHGYVSAESFRTYFQTVKDEDGKPVDPKEVAVELGVKPEDYDKAIDLKQDLAIPTENYARFIAPTEHNAFFAQEMRFSPLEPTSKDVEAQAKEESDRQAAQAKATEGQNEPVQSEPETLASRLGKRMKVMLTSLGLGNIPGLKKIADLAPDAYGQVFEESVRNLEKLGVDVSALERIVPEIGETPEGAGAMEQSAHHGSTITKPFEKFSSEKIGTGIGAQVRGRGHYFSGGRELADHIRTEFSKAPILIGGKQISPQSALERQAFSFLDESRGNVDAALRSAESAINSNEVIGVLEAWKKVGVTKEKGRLYEVDIPEDTEYLDWDTPLVKQEKKILKVLNQQAKKSGFGDLSAEALPKSATGQDLYKLASQVFGSDEAASRYFAQAGIAGVKYMDAGVRGYVVFDDKLIQIKRYEQDKRGFSEFLKDRIRLAFTKAADASTFLHEMGHIWLEITGSVYKQLKGKDAATLTVEQKEFMERADALLEFAGAKSFEKLTKAQHEKIAQETEKYFATGKAPSTKLAKAFQQMKEWFLELWKNLRGQVEVNPAVSNWLDRLLASKEEVAIARAQQAMEPEASPILKAAQVVFGDKGGKRVADALEANSRATAEKVDPKVLEAVTRDKEAWFQEELEREKKVVAEGVNKDQRYIALSILQYGLMPDGTPVPEALGGIKLSEKDTKAVASEPVLKALPKDALTKEGGYTPDLAAEELNRIAGTRFTSGDELLQTVANLENKDALIERLARERLNERHGDLLADGGLYDEVLKAIHTPESAKLLHLELETLASDDFATFGQLFDKVGRPVRSASEYREAAREAISKKKVEEVDSSVYEQAEKDFAADAMKALLKGDIEAALDFKEWQFISRAMTLEARAVEKKAGKDALKTAQRLGVAAVKATEKAGKEAVKTAQKEAKETLKQSQRLGEAAVKATEKTIRAASREEMSALKSLIKETTSRLRGLEEYTKDAQDAVARETPRRLQNLIRVYQRAEQDAGKRALSAVLKGDLETYGTEKERQLMNHELYRAASEALERADGTAKLMRKYDKPLKRQQLAKAKGGYLEQIDAFRERFDFKRASERAVEKRQSLREWVDKQTEETGIQPVIPEKLLNDAYKQNYRDVPIEELEEIRRVVENIDHLAGLKNKLLAAKDRREFEAARNDAVKSIEGNSQGPRPKEIETRLPQDEPLRWLGGIFASHRKFSNFLRMMDGWKDGGPLWELLVRPMNEAGDREASMKVDAAKSLKKLFSLYSVSEIGFATPGIQRGMYKKEYIPELKQSLTRMGQLMVALNWGNLDNRQKLMDGYGWNDAQVKAILDRLTEKDWQFVQGVWDFIDSYWPETKALSERIDGIAPDKVEAAPVQTKFGIMKGGYFPLKYDERQSPRAYADQAKEAAERAMRGAFIRSTTRHGHREGRVEGVKRPIRLDFGTIFEHTTEVIHDTTHYEFLIDANRLLGDKKLQETIISHYGDVVYRQLQKAIQDIAAGEIPSQKSVEKSLNWIRTGASIANMGWGVMTSLKQPLGLTQSVVRVGPRWIAKGVGRMLGNPSSIPETIRWIKEKSDFMRLRAMTQMREINEVRNSLRLRGKLSPLEDSYFWLITRMQMVADIPTWIGAYEKAMAQAKEQSSTEDMKATEARAVQLANQAVIDSQGGGQIKDLAEIQRGSPIWKIWTTFYNYFNTTLNLTREAFGRATLTPEGIGRLSVDLLMLYAVPAFLVVIIDEVLRGDGDDDDEILEKTLVETGSSALGVFVFGRELTGAVKGFSGYEGPAGTSIFGDVGRLGKQISQGEADTAFWRSLNDVMGTLLHYPAGQIDKTVRGIDALLRGETENPASILVGPPRR